MTTELLIKPQTIKLTSRFSLPITKRRYTLDTEWAKRDFKIWTTIARDTSGNTIVPLSRSHGNELSRSINLSTLGYFYFWIDENFNLLACKTGDSRPEHYQLFDFYKMNHSYYGFSAEELEHVKRIHKSLIDAVVNIKVFHPQFIWCSY
jgi:hypothetical protein